MVLTDGTVDQKSIVSITDATGIIYYQKQATCVCIDLICPERSRRNNREIQWRNKKSDAANSLTINASKKMYFKF